MYGWVVVYSGVSPALSQAERYRTERAPVSDVALVKSHSPLIVCVCAKEHFSMYMCVQTMSAAALFHKCILIGCCIPSRALCSKAHSPLIAQVNCTFDLRFKSHVFLNGDQKIGVSFIFKRVLIWLLESL